MKNIITIMRRDLGAYFTSPIGYIYMIVFLLISVGLYMTSFFMFPVADMRGFFGNLPLLMCVFIPAITMRVWAEERKENTWEMLLTFPMKASELVLGKFLACLTFFAVTLAATFTVPLMLSVLGNPDNGSVLGGYLGTFLLGAFFLSMGIFFSGFCKDQIVAFVLTLLSCFALFLVGTNFIAAQLDGLFSEDSMFAGIGSLLGSLLGVVDHFEAFTRGVIEMGDILYFVAWIALFLVLNIMYIEGRSRPGAKMFFSTAVAVCLGIGLVFNWLVSEQSLGRFDMTEDSIYTVSDASKRILGDLDTPVQVKYYVTRKNKMPTQLNSVEQDVVDKLDELRVASGGMIDFATVYMDASSIISSDPFGKADDEDESEDDAIEKRMLEKGIMPFTVQAISEDGSVNRLIYSSIGIAYKDKKEEIIPQIMPQTLPTLEYALVNTIYKMTLDKAPVVALVAPKEAVKIDPQMRQMLMQMGQEIPTQDDPYEYLQQILEREKYEVNRVELTQESGLPEEYDTLVVVNPRSLSERQRWEINRAVVEGNSVILAVQNYEWDYQPRGGRMSLFKRDEEPGINELLENYGLGVSRDILMDVNNVPLTIQSNSLFSRGQQVKYPMHILVSNDSMDKETAMTNRLDAVFYLWGSSLDIDDDELASHGLDSRVIMSTSERAWEVEVEKLSQSAIEEPSSTHSYPLLVQVSGQFPDAYKDAARPKWPVPQPMPNQPPPPPAPEEDAATEIVPAPGKLVLLGCSQTFRKNFLQQGNLDLFLNMVDAVTLGDDLASVRGRKPINRLIDKPTKSQKRTWRIINYGVVSAAIAFIGIVTAVNRRRSRNAYTIRYQSSSEL